MSVEIRDCWRNCYWPGDEAFLADSDRIALDRMEDSLAPLPPEVARIRHAITRFESCYHAADMQAGWIIHAINAGHCPPEPEGRPPQRAEQLRIACELLRAWLKDPASPPADLCIGPWSTRQLLTSLGEPTDLKRWQVQRILDKVGRTPQESPGYRFMAVGVSDEDRAAAARDDSDESRCLRRTRDTIIHDTVNGRDAAISLAAAIDLLQPCNWNFPANLAIVLAAVGNDLYPDRPFACCSRNIRLSPLRGRLLVISQSLLAYRRGEPVGPTDAHIRKWLGEPTPAKRWLAGSLGRTIAFHFIDSPPQRQFWAAAP